MRNQPRHNCIDWKRKYQSNGDSIILDCTTEVIQSIVSEPIYMYMYAFVFAGTSVIGKDKSDPILDLFLFVCLFVLLNLCILLLLLQVKTVAYSLKYTG